MDPKDKWKGWVTAVNADDGSVKWKYQSPTPMIAGITATAGSLVFTGDLNGDAIAFTAADGKQLWKKGAGGPIGGGVITYLANSKQHIAVAAGITSKRDGRQQAAMRGSLFMLFLETPRVAAVFPPTIAMGDSLLFTAQFSIHPRGGFLSDVFPASGSSFTAAGNVFPTLRNLLRAPVIVCQRQYFSGY